MFFVKASGRVCPRNWYGSSLLSSGPLTRRGYGGYPFQMGPSFTGHPKQRTECRDPSTKPCTSDSLHRRDGASKVEVRSSPVVVPDQTRDWQHWLQKLWRTLTLAFAFHLPYTPRTHYWSISWNQEVKRSLLSLFPEFLRGRGMLAQVHTDLTFLLSSSSLYPQS